MIKLTNQQTETTNEVAIVQNGGLVLQSETEGYTIYKDEKGKFVRKAKYSDYSSFEATTREERIWLLNLLEGEEGTGNGLKDQVGKTIVVQDVIIRKYDRINEDTGFQEDGVLTYLITPEKEVYVTSAKSVYFSITHIMDLFGKPTDPEWENVTVLVGSEKMANGTAIKIKMIG
jgi:hypothetical protein